MTEKTPSVATFSDRELELLKRVAERDGITVEEAVTNLGKAALARQLKKKTGKAPARVYSMRRG